jgi:DNA invertase Pin-like site-specific DNA recombinase
MIAPRTNPVFSFGYGRASKARDVQAWTKEAQEAAIVRFHEYALAPEGIAFQGTFFDPDTSGKTTFFQREAGAALNRQLRAGDHFIVAKLDRAFRNPVDGLTTLENLHKRGVIVHVLNYNIDTSTPIGEMFITFGLAIARWERRVIGERTREVLQWKREHGFPVGNGVYAPIGWKKVGKRRKALYVVNLPERNFCRQIVELRKTVTRDNLSLQFARRGLTWRGKPRCSTETLKRIEEAVPAGFPLPNGKLEAGKLDE